MNTKVSFNLVVTILSHYKYFKQNKLMKNKFVPNILKTSTPQSPPLCTCDVSKLSKKI